MSRNLARWLPLTLRDRRKGLVGRVICAARPSRPPVVMDRDRSRMGCTVAYAASCSKMIAMSQDSVT